MSDVNNVKMWKNNGVIFSENVNDVSLMKAEGGNIFLAPIKNMRRVRVYVFQSGTYTAEQFFAYGISEIIVRPVEGGRDPISELVDTGEDLLNQNVISVTEGGQKLYFDVKHLWLINGEATIDRAVTDDWVDQSAVVLKSKIISKPGAYEASKDKCYGYDMVTVQLEGPAYIKVVTPPSDVNYLDGQTINFSGMVMKAYLESGEVWVDENHPNGVIPISELRFPEKTASLAAASATLMSSPLVSYEVPCGDQFYYVTHGSATGMGTNTRYRSFTGMIQAVELKSSVSYDHLFASDTPSDTLTDRELFVWDRTGEVYGDTTRTWSLNSDYTYQGKTVYYRIRSVSATGSAMSDISLESAPAVNNKVAWTLVFGTKLSGEQDILVEWKHEDNTFETSFKIKVSGA